MSVARQTAEKARWLVVIGAALINALVLGAGSTTWRARLLVSTGTADAQVES